MPAPTRAIAGKYPPSSTETARTLLPIPINAPVGCYLGIPLGPLTLHGGGTAQRIHQRASLSQRLDEPAIMRSGRRIEQFGPDRPEALESTTLVRPDQA